MLAQLASLPALAPIVTRLLTLLMRPDADMKQIARLIESDAALSARLLSLSRRADRAVAAAHVSVERAVTLVGLRTIRAMVVATKVLEVFEPSAAKPSGRFNRTEFWKHCLAVGCAARQIAARMRSGIDPDEAFLGGLLHDLGKVALDACIPKSYERVIQEAERKHGDILVVERQVLGTDHTVAGRRLAERWQLPPELVECIWLHHLPPEALPPDIRASATVHVVWLANLLVRAHHLGFSGDQAAIPSMNEAAAAVGADAEACREVLRSLPAEIAERAEWIGLNDLNDGRLYVDALAESTQAMARLNDDFHTQNQQLARTVEYFSALLTLNRCLTPGASLAEACTAGASAVRQALGVAGAVVYVRDKDGTTTASACNGTGAPAEARVLDAPSGAAAARDDHLAADVARGGIWIAPAPSGAADVVEAHRSIIGGGAAWLIPIVREREWIGGAVFAAEASDVARWRGEAGELEALSTAVGLALTHAILHADSSRLSEGLAWTQQRLSAAQSELAATRSVRMTAELAAGAGHELNTPLAIISGRAQLLREAASDPKSRAWLDEIVTAAHRASDIISDLMDFAEPAPPKIMACDVSALLRQTVEQFRASAANRAIAVEIADDLPAAVCDVDHLRNTLLELLKNAVEATEAGSGRVDVKASADSSDDSVVIEVADNGRGMTPDVLARAFDPFFSHRPAGRGRGMGLSRAQRWMQANGGSVTLESTESQGTVARVRVPGRKVTSD